MAEGRGAHAVRHCKCYAHMHPGAGTSKQACLKGPESMARLHSGKGPMQAQENTVGAAHELAALLCSATPPSLPLPLTCSQL